MEMSELGANITELTGLDALVSAIPKARSLVDSLQSLAVNHTCRHCHTATLEFSLTALASSVTAPALLYLVHPWTRASLYPLHGPGQFLDLQSHLLHAVVTPNINPNIKLTYS